MDKEKQNSQKEFESNTEIVKDCTEKIIAIDKEAAEYNILTSLVSITVDNSIYNEKISNYLLIATGASLTLFISNSTEVINVFGKGTYKCILVFLLISALCGFLSKLFHIFSTITFNTFNESKNCCILHAKDFNEKQNKELKEVEHVIKINKNKLDMNRINNQFLELFPVFFQKIIQLNRNKKIDKYASLKGTIHDFLKHFAFFGIQLLTIFLTFIIAVFGME